MYTLSITIIRVQYFQKEREGDEIRFQSSWEMNKPFRCKKSDGSNEQKMERSGIEKSEILPLIKVQAEKLKRAEKINLEALPWLGRESSVQKFAHAR